jgi:hypothetical protein
VLLFGCEAERRVADKPPTQYAKARKAISDALDTEVQLRSKKELLR